MLQVFNWFTLHEITLTDWITLQEMTLSDWFTIRYDTREGKWSMLEPMNTSRSAVDIAVIDGSLYAVGGNDGCSSLNTVERYY